MIKTFSLDLDLLKVWFNLSLESESIESRRSAKISKRKKAITYPFEAQITISFFQYLKDIIS